MWYSYERTVANQAVILALGCCKDYFLTLGKSETYIFRTYSSYGYCTVPWIVVEFSFSCYEYSYEYRPKIRGPAGVAGPFALFLLRVELQ